MINLCFLFFLSYCAFPYCNNIKQNHLPCRRHIVRWHESNFSGGMLVLATQSKTMNYVELNGLANNTKFHGYHSKICSIRMNIECVSTLYVVRFRFWFHFVNCHHICLIHAIRISLNNRQQSNQLTWCILTRIYVIHI